MNKEILVVEMSDSWMFLSNKKAFWYELLEDWILFLVIYAPSIIGLYYFYRDNSLIYRGVTLILPIFAFAFTRRYVRYLSLFILFNLISICTAYFIGGVIAEKIIFAVILVIFAIASVKKRYSEIVEHFNLLTFIFCEGFLALCYLVSFNLRLEVMTRLVTGCGIVVALSCTLYIHLIRTQKLMEWEGQFAHKFSSRIKKLKLIFSSGITFIISFLIWLSWRTGIFQLLDDLQNRINKLFTLNPSTVPKEPPKIESAPKPQGDNFEQFKMLGGEAKDNIFIKILLKVIEIAVILIVIAFAAYVLWMIFLKLRELYRQFYSKQSNSEEEREVILSPEDITKEFSERFNRVKNGFNELFDRSNQRKIRRSYYRIIQKGKIHGLEIESSNTSGELEAKMKKNINKDFHEVTELYDKARYSNQNCSDEEVERTKKYFDF